MKQRGSHGRSDQSRRHSQVQAGEWDRRQVYRSGVGRDDSDHRRSARAGVDCKHSGPGESGVGMAENGKPWGCSWKQRPKNERGKWTQVERTFATYDEMDQCLKKVMEDESIT